MTVRRPVVVTLAGVAVVTFLLQGGLPHHEPGTRSAGPVVATPSAGPVAPALAPHDAVSAGEPTPGPGVVAAAVQVADDFAHRWTRPHPDWHDRLAAIATGELAAALDGATPIHPAPEVTGPGEPLQQAPEWVRVRVPTDRGVLLLDVVRTADGWRVAVVDWQRG